MTIREKVILGLMIIAIIYGAFEVLNFAFSTKTDGTPEQSRQERPEYLRTAENINDSIQKNKLSEKESYVMDLISKPWTKDIFYNRHVSNPSKVKQAKYNSANNIQKWKNNFNYNGYVDMNGEIFVVINGIEYTVGDKLDKSNFKLIEANPERILLKKGET